MLIDEFIKYEENMRLFDKKINGFNYWMYIRISIYYDILNAGYLQDKDNVLSPSSKHVKISIKSKVRMLCKCLIRSPFYIFGKKDMLVYQDAIIYNPEHKFYECPRTQVVVENFKGSLILLQDCILHKDMEPLQFGFTRYVGIVYYIGKLKLKLYSLNKKKQTKMLEMIKNDIGSMFENINSVFNVELESDTYIKRIYQMMFMRRTCFEYYSKILNRTKPKCIVEQCYYSFRNMVLNEVANVQGIPTVELQHGVMGQDHIAYNFARIRDINSFPNYILTFSEYWNHITRFPISGSKIISVGYPYLESKVNRKNSAQKTSGSVVILLISQCVEGSEWPRKLIDFALELCEYVQKSNLEEYRILYKMHPREKDGQLEAYRVFDKYDKIIKLVDNMDMNLYDCFSISDIQVSIASTGIYEGLAYGLNTFILNVEGCSNQFDGLIDKGYAKLIEKPEDMFDGYNKIMSTNSASRELFWEKNSVANIMRVLNTIMERE